MAHTATAERAARRARSMPLAGHLRELRRRATVVAAAVILGAVAGWFLTDHVLALLAMPLGALSERTGQLAALNFDSVTTAFELRMRLALLLGVLVSSPVWMFQIAAFLIPGLTRREARYSLGFVGAAVPLFLCGAAAGIIVLPHIVEMMLGFTPAGSAAMMRAGAYYEFALRLMITTGVAFALPVVVVLLNTVGLLSGRTVLLGWRWAIVAITAFTAMSTPAADVIGMLLLALPMVALYFAAVGVCLWNDRRRSRRLAAAFDGTPSAASDHAAPA